MGRILLLTVLLVACRISGAAAAEIRHDDVLYLDDWKQPPLQLKVLRRAAITFSRDPRSVVAHLAQGQTVHVVGLGERLHYVSARIATGPARGWVEAGALEAPPEELLARLRQRRERMLAHRELIARREVALGMSRDEVRASLGRPDRKSRLRSADGEEEQWLYVTYRYLPHYRQYHDQKGQLRQLVTYRRVPAGHKVITFRDGELVAIAEEVQENGALQRSW